MKESGKRGRALALVMVVLLVISAISVAFSVRASMSVRETNEKLSQVTMDLETVQEQLNDLKLAQEKTADASSGEVPAAEPENEPAVEAETETETEPETQSMYSPDTYNYLAIGNSITKHSICDYWWGTWGMAASTAEKDYPHLASKMLEERYGPVTMQVLNFSTWETQSYDRAQLLPLMDKYLDEYVNLVTIQLGEDCYDMTTFENDYIELIRYIREHAPNAHVMVVGDVWEFAPRDELKLAACVKSEIPFVDLAEMKDNGAYQCGLGAVVYGDDGQQHVVEHAGAARHPSDAGHQFMAEKIVAALNYWDDGQAQ